MKNYKVAVVGATGLVGSKMLEILEERHFPVGELLPVASEKSVGKVISFAGKDYKVISPAEAVERRPEIALFSAGATVSKEWAPRFAEAGCTVVDNSSCWRMDPTKKLIVPEINGDVLTPEDRIIANPNCSTIGMLMALWPLHKRYGIKRIVVSTYQSVSGSGQKGVAQLQRERGQAFAAEANGGWPDSCDDAPEVSSSLPRAYPKQIDLNVLPHIDIFMESGYTKEEEKMVNETHKIFNDYSIGVSATTVRVPVICCHSESVNVEFENEYTLEEVRSILSSDEKAPGVILMDDPAHNVYPTAVECAGRDEVFVGRIRRDTSAPHALNLWVVSDNLRKGAATNAVQIAELLR